MSGLPPDPFAEEDPREEAHRLFLAIAEPIAADDAATTHAAIGAMSRAELELTITGIVFTINEALIERPPDGARIRRAVRAFVKEWRR